MIILLVLAACGWLAITVLALALCAMAKRGEERIVEPGCDAQVDGAPARRTRFASAA